MPGEADDHAASNGCFGSEPSTDAGGLPEDMLEAALAAQEQDWGRGDRIPAEERLRQNPRWPPTRRRARRSCITNSSCGRNWAKHRIGTIICGGFLRMLLGFSSCARRTRSWSGRFPQARKG